MAAFPVCPVQFGKTEIFSPFLIQTHELMASDRDEQFLSRFHQEEASFSRT